MMTGITAHMIVKNEDQWVSFAIQSVLPYVDHFLVTDTGSTDQTVKIIQSISSTKIHFNQIKINSRTDVTKIRDQQIRSTKTPWIWIVDGDEIYPDDLAKEIISVTHKNKSKVIVVRRYDLLGDVYHKQNESVGSYQMFGHTGHLLIRLINLALLPGLHVKGEYPLESYYDGKGVCINDLSSTSAYITTRSLYHAMYLKRSSLGGNLPMFNRSKYRIEKGIEIKGLPPKIFSGMPKRSLLYELIATLITPIKNLKRQHI